MTNAIISKIYQSLAAELSKQKVEPNCSNANYKLASGIDGETNLFITLAHAEALLTELQLDALKDAGCLLDSGRPTRVSWGTKKQYAIGVAWTKVEEHLKSITVGKARVTVLERRVKTLEKELKEARESSVADIALAHLLDMTSKSYQTGKLRPSVKQPIRRRTASDRCEGVASLVLSDWHWGETVEAKCVNGLNAYDLQIAARRATRIFETTLELLDPKQGKYDALVVPILGDMLSGIIHDELVLTNDSDIQDCMLSLIDKLEWGLLELAPHFPTVQVSCVYGNHGRMDKRTMHKRQGAFNYETMVYKLLEHRIKARLGDQCNVDFKIGASPDVITMVYGKKFLYTHGDQFSDYEGSALDKVRKGDTIKRKRAYEAEQLVHDYLVCGHFHTYSATGNIIINGSLVGYNEFAFNKNLSIERPQQALFVSHGHYGITRHMSVFADEPPAPAKVLAPVSLATA